MEIEESNYCRLCADLTPNSKMIDLVTNTVKCREVAEKLAILKHEFINIFREQNLPKTVCYLCLDSLYRAVAFVERVEASQVKFKDIFEPVMAVETVWQHYSETSRDPFESDETKLSNKDAGQNLSQTTAFDSQLTNPVIDTLGNLQTQVQLPKQNEYEIETVFSSEAESSRKLYESSQYQEEYMRKYDQHVMEIKNVEKKDAVKKTKNPLPLSVKQISKITDKSWTGYPWTCDLCFAGFTNVYLLREHTKRIHYRCFAMKCVDCLETADCYISFVYHVRNHRPFLKLYCPHCNARFNKTDQKEHIKMHFSGPERMCDSCGQIFPSVEELHRHLDLYKPLPPKRLASIARLRPTIIDDKTCNICNKVFTTAGSARAHKLIHTERKKEQICDVCGKDFFRKSDLSHHRLIHDTTDPKICKICKKSFATNQRLRNHVLTHSAVKPFQCYVCERNFRLKRQMKDHMIIHTGEKPYKCDHCDRTFRFKTTLKSHLLQHTGEKPFVCNNCGREFANWSNCNQHMKIKHGTTLAKHVVTAVGKVPVNPLTGKVKKVKTLDSVKEWTEMILEPPKRHRKVQQ